MRLCSPRLAGAFVLLFPFLASAVRVIESTAIEDCGGSSSNLTASLFNIVFTPDNDTVTLDVVGNSDIQGNVTLNVTAAVYGYSFLKEQLDPCKLDIENMCPLTAIPLQFNTNYQNISTSVIGRIPGIAYGVPDLDATVTVEVCSFEDPSIVLACVRTRLSNRKTVHQVGVGWATAIVVGIGLLASGIVSGLGYSNAASHIAVYTTSLFNYFQAIAMIGLCAVPLPPIVQSWTQDFVWSMGIIRVTFLQKFASWYQVATGGTADTILESLSFKSVQVVKRGLEVAHSLARRAHGDETTASGEFIVRGIDRVAFLAKIESTNIFFTSITFFVIFLSFTVLGVVAFKYACEFAIMKGWMQDTKFQNLRENYRVTLKGVIFRLILMGFPPMAALCLWEFTEVDSPGEVVLAVIMFFGLAGALGFAASQVFATARRSEQLHRTPAYILYSNATVLNKWGFLYVQYRASAYYYVAASLVYFIVKALFVAFAQGSGTAQAIALLIIEVIMLISASVIRPWMDKPTNAMNVAICAINFVNAVFLVIFTGIFGGPGLLIGVSGVVFFIVNAVFALVLLIAVLLAATYSIVQKNPETRYQTIADNRASFIKSQTFLTTELDELGASARVKGEYYDHSRENSQYSTQMPPSSPSAPYFHDSGVRSYSDLATPHAQMQAKIEQSHARSF